MLTLWESSVDSGLRKPPIRLQSSWFSHWSYWSSQSFWWYFWVQRRSPLSKLFRRWQDKSQKRRWGKVSTTVILLIVAAILGILYFLKRSARLRKQAKKDLWGLFFERRKSCVKTLPNEKLSLFTMGVFACSVPKILKWQKCLSYWNLRHCCSNVFMVYRFRFRLGIGFGSRFCG